MRLHTKDIDGTTLTENHSKKLFDYDFDTDASRDLSWNKNNGEFVHVLQLEGPLSTYFPPHDQVRMLNEIPGS